MATTEYSLPMNDDQAPPPPERKQGAMSGGRWILLWVVRPLVILALVVVIINGLLRIFGVGTGTGSAAPEQDTTNTFPVLEGSAFAAQFAGVYLDTAADDRLDLLAEYLGESQARALLPPEESWQATDLYVAAVDPADEHNAVISLNVRLNGVPMAMDVPVYADEDGMAITGAPALLPVETGAERPAAPRMAHDAETAEDIEPVLEGFFDSYATSEESDHLDRYVEPGQELPSLPTGMVELVQVRDVLVPQGEGDQPRQVQATVVWQILPPAPEGEETDEDAEEADEDADAPLGQVTQVYALTMVREGSSWYVRDISGTPTATK